MNKQKFTGLAGVKKDGDRDHHRLVDEAVLPPNWIVYKGKAYNRLSLPPHILEESSGL